MIRIALAQLNQAVGDIDGNVARLQSAIDQAHSAGAQVLATPELAVPGYPPEDLVLKRSFVDANRDALDRIARSVRELVAVIGFVDQDGDHLYNAAAICHRGGVIGVYRKQLLPNYGVFDERRYFEPGDELVMLDTDQGILGVCICEDLWFDPGPAIALGDAGAQVIININASPFHKNKLTERTDLLRARAERARAAMVYVNMVGGQDELVFDGASMVIGADGELAARWPQFQEHFGVVAVSPGPGGAAGTDRFRTQTLTVHLNGRPASDEARFDKPAVDALSPEAEIYGALRLSLADYVAKNGFEKTVVGLSGGIDSALTAAIAVDALGPNNVLAVAMPSEYSTAHSLQDSKQLAANLGIEVLQVPIARILDAYLRDLTGAFGEAESGLAEENLQARIRGNLLMFASNRYGHLVVATGNKSEMACGYATLYGDMAGGFGLLKDVFKKEVYELARWRNSVKEIIPQAIIDKAPSAELRPDQKDSDSLPPYDILDPILEAYIERDESAEEIAARGFDEQVVRDVISLVDRAEYKRRQAPPGPKVTTKAFGRDRRLPISSKWRESQSVVMPETVTGERKPR